MNKPPASSHDFDDPFDADDDFAVAGDETWRTSPGLGDLGEQDPFLSPAGSDPFAAPPPPAPEAAGTFNPVGEMLAGAESALGEVSVPRITIHIFCERPETAAVAEKASRDRRLDRATTVVKPGGLVAAVEQYRNQPTPALVIVESLDEFYDRFVAELALGTRV